MADVLSAVWAGGVHTLHGRLSFLADQLFGDTAEKEALYRRAALYGIFPSAATFATGNVTATGTNGSVIPINTIIKLDAATAYRVTTGQTIASGTATIPVVALLAGVAGNLPDGATVSLETAIAGVNSTMIVATGGIGGGIDEQGVDQVRARYLLRLREPPQGGADQDYVAVALKVAGVTRAWEFNHELGLGTVVVRTVFDDPDTGDVVFPDAGQVAAVQAAESAARPITAVVTVLAPTQLAVAFTIHVVPDTADTRAAVTAELVDLMARVAEPGDGAGRGTILLSAIRTAIGVAEGVTDYTVTVPAANVVPSTGELQTVGVITWV